MNRRSPHRGNLGCFEPLESRALLAGDFGLTMFTNPQDRYDANNDGVLTAFDALTIINDFSRGGSRPLTTLAGSTQPDAELTTPYVDINGDGFITPFDALLVINALDRPRARISAQVSDLNGKSITTLPVGGFFKVTLVADDLREIPSLQEYAGFLSLFSDLSFDADKVEPASDKPVAFGFSGLSVLNSGFSWRGVPGRFEEVGGRYYSLEASRQATVPFVQFTFRAISVGAVQLTPSACAEIGHDVRFYNRLAASDDGKVTVGQLAFLGASLTVVDAEAPQSDATPLVNINSPSITEIGLSSDYLVFLVRLSAPSTATVKVSYGLVGVVPSDASGTYSPANGVVERFYYTNDSGSEVTFNPGETIKPVFINVNGRGYFEPDETFGVQLLSATNARLGTALGIGTIRHTAVLPVIEFPDRVYGYENKPSTTVPVTLSGPSTEEVTVVYTTEADTAMEGSDYIPQSGSLTFAAGETSQNIVLTLLDDDVYRGYRQFHVGFSSTRNGALWSGDCTIAIFDDEFALPRISMIDSLALSNSESGGVQIRLQLSHQSFQPVTVTYVTSDESAIPGLDYVAQTGTVTFAPHKQYASITIATLGDAEPEAYETFRVSFGTPVGAVMPASEIEAVIREANGPSVNFSQTAFTVAEGTPLGAGFVAVRLSQPSPFPVTVEYRSMDVKQPAAGFNPATAGNDYDAVSGTLTFLPNETSATITIPIYEDNLFEVPEQFRLRLSHAVNATLSILNFDEAVVTIYDFQQPPITPTLTFSDANVLEGNNGERYLFFTLSLSQPSTKYVTGFYATSSVGGTATAGVDYIAYRTPESLGVLLFPGETLKVIQIPILTDTTPELDETFSLDLIGVGNAIFTRTSAVGTITNDD